MHDLGIKSYPLNELRSLGTRSSIPIRKYREALSDCPRD